MWILFVLLIVIAASCSCFYFQSLTTNKPEIPSAAGQPYDPKIHGDLFNPEMSSPQVCESEPLFATTITEIQEDSEPLFTATITEIQEDSEPLLTATITEIEEDEPLQINKKTKRIKANVKP